VIFITKLDQAANSLTDPSTDAGGCAPFLFDELALDSRHFSLNPPPDRRNANKWLGGFPDRRKELAPLA
jgi:hypothetical protein